MTLRFWLAAMDVIVFFGGFGSRAYLWALTHASGAAYACRSAEREAEAMR